MGGEDFDTEAGALEARYEREAAVNSVIVNLANVVSVRATRTDSAEAGQPIRHTKYFRSRHWNMSSGYFVFRNENILRWPDAA